MYQFRVTPTSSGITLRPYDYVPKCKVSAQPSPRWFMQEISHLFKCIHIKRRLVKKSHSTSQLATSLSVASKLRLMILSSQNSFHKNLVHSHYSNPKSLFKHLCFLSSPDKLPQVMIPLLFINLVTKLNYQRTLVLCSLVAILYFHLLMNILHHNQS